MKRKKLENHGFTVVELIVSFSISLIIVALLFQIVLDLKDLYVKDGVKTELLIKQSLIMKNTIEEMNREDLVGISKCSEKSQCYTFTYLDGTTKNLTYDAVKKIYQFGSFKTKLVSGSKFGKLQVTNQVVSTVANEKKNSILTIQLPITNSLVDGDYGMKIVHLYSSSKITITGF